MYNPQKFKSDNLQEAFELMDQYPFATLISISEGKPVVSHLPLTPIWTGEKIELIGHLARANSHWKVLAESKVTAIFHGPHTYITPMWYAKNDVPTWNYLTVHATGNVQLIEDYEGIIGCLKTQTAHTERHWRSGWEFFVPEDLKGDRLTKNIAGFKVNVEEINFKKKLSQNRPADQGGILMGLESRSDENSQAILFEMSRSRDI